MSELHEAGAVKEFQKVANWGGRKKTKEMSRWRQGGSTSTNGKREMRKESVFDAKVNCISHLVRRKNWFKKEQANRGGSRGGEKGAEPGGFLRRRNWHRTQK